MADINENIIATAAHPLDEAVARIRVTAFSILGVS
jgi:hypothetical protein